MKTLVAIDGSECSMRALDYVANRPWKNEDQFMVISVVEPIPADLGVGIVPPPAGSIEDKMYDECAEISGNGGRKLQEALPLNPILVSVEAGLVAETICDTAARWEADLIVLGSHGRKGIAHLLLGSVAEEVLKKSPCSVEVIKAKAGDANADEHEEVEFMHTN
ncbi:MAG: universal stress protein [Candidatus Melainabacteria bacterium]|mgnify:CR=1 FL=1|nr:universal stress protein [Candidatus Melainabacteria bacterium]